MYYVALFPHTFFKLAHNHDLWLIDMKVSGQNIVENVRYLQSIAAYVTAFVLEDLPASLQNRLIVHLTKGG